MVTVAECPPIMIQHLNSDSRTSKSGSIHPLVTVWTKLSDILCCSYLVDGRCKINCEYLTNINSFRVFLLMTYHFTYSISAFIS